MMGPGKGNGTLSKWQFLVSMLDFWGEPGMSGTHKKLFPTSMGMVLLKQWHMEPKLPWRHLTTEKGKFEKSDGN